jgi:hypothetical protein
MNAWRFPRCITVTISRKTQPRENISLAPGRKFDAPGEAISGAQYMGVMMEVLLNMIFDWGFSVRRAPPKSAKIT